MTNYIKLNDNRNHLSLGNLENIIKKLAINKSSATQTEIFCTIFNIDNISETTVGNYCTGYRAIGNEYKQIYVNYRKNFKKDRLVLLKTISNLISIIEGYICNFETEEDINNNITIKKLAKSVHPLIKNDIYIPIDTKKELLKLLSNNSYYEFISKILFFIILEKTQPLNSSDSVEETIEKILESTNISINDLKEYLEITFTEGISQVGSLKKLAKDNNPYALHELGNLEYNGMITGYPRYEEAFNYYKKAASFNHPNSNWMVAHMILNKQIGSLTDSDIDEAWKYLEIAYNKKSISATNTIGLCYLFGFTKDKKKNITTAIKYFKEAANKNYVYAYNNLGIIYEEKKDYEKAFNYFSLSAAEEESWACNRIALYYYNGIYVEKDIQKAFDYFSIGASAPIKTRNNWNIYNLINLFYLKGSSSIGIKKDITKSLALLDTIKNFEPANELYLYCYYDLYLETNDKLYMKKIAKYLNILNNKLDTKEKKEIEAKLQSISNYQIKINL